MSNSERRYAPACTRAGSRLRSRPPACCASHSGSASGRSDRLLRDAIAALVARAAIRARATLLAAASFDHGCLFLATPVAHQAPAEALPAVVTLTAGHGTSPSPPRIYWGPPPACRQARASP